jgi:anaerobic ribonucleoside-triphosphate reductase activating protein
MTLRVLDIIGGTSVDGPGLRTSIYLAGCPHHCEGCHNQQSWDPMGGIEMTVDEIAERIIEEDFNVTFSGGDPLFQIDGLLELAQKIKTLGKTMWLYTGYTFEEVATDKSLSRILPYVEAIVDGRFDINKRDTALRFKGSSNQRIIDVQKSIAENHISLLEL